MTEKLGMLITKENGEQESFDPGKLRRSLRQAGAPRESIDAIVAQVAGELVPGMHTSKIYRRAFSLLKKYRDMVPAARYSLKRAVFALGPSGYPFERYVAHIFGARGFATKTQQMLQGKCVEHEVDFTGEREHHMVVGEVKFHNRQGIKTDVQTALYVHARFKDINAKRQADGKETLSACWLVTNTKFTTSAIAYGVCVGLSLLGWNYPQKRSLQEYIEESGMHPITCLPSLTPKEKKRLLDDNLVLCRDLSAERGRLKRLDIPASKIDAIIAESRGLCSLDHHGYNRA